MSHDTRDIFTYGDFISPDLDLDLYLALVSHLHLRHLFSSIFAKFALATASGPVSAADKAKDPALTFDLSLPQHLALLTKF